VKKSNVICIVPIMLATIELTNIISFWGYIIFFLTLVTSALYVLLMNKINRQIFELPIFLIFVISIFSSIFSDEILKSLIYTIYWLITYLALGAYLSKTCPANIKGALNFIILLCGIEFAIRSLLLSSGQGNAYHSVASLTLAIGLLMLGRRSWLAKVIFTGLILFTSSLKIIIALVVIRLTRINKFLLLAVTLGFGFILSYYIVGGITRYEDALGKVWHFNGRFFIWDALLEKYKSWPLTHQMFGAGFHIGHQFEMYNEKFYNAHNIFISLLLNQGFVGLTLFLIVIISRLKAIIKMNLTSLQNALFILFLISSLANSSFFAAPSLVGFFGMFIIAFTRRRENFG
jgi:hypothetical protein